MTTIIIIIILSSILTIELSILATAFAFNEVPAAAPGSVVRSRRAHNFRKANARKQALAHQAERISHGKSWGAVTYRAMARTAAALAAAAKPAATKRFNSRKIKRSAHQATRTINLQPIVAFVAPQAPASAPISKQAQQSIDLIYSATNIDRVYNCWVKSTEDIGFDPDVYQAYKTRRNVLRII